jgi:hypothetical protein
MLNKTDVFFLLGAFFIILLSTLARFVFILYWHYKFKNINRKLKNINRYKSEEMTFKEDKHYG